MKSIIKDLVSKGLIYGLGLSLNSFIGFLLIPFFTRYLRADEYGRFALAEMLLNLLLTTFGMGLNVALLSRYPKILPEDRSELMSSVFSFVLLSTLGMDLIFIVVMTLWGYILLPSLTREMFLLVGGIATIETVWLLFATFFRAEGFVLRYITISLIQMVIGLSATVGFIVDLGCREEGILYGRLTGDLAFLGALLPYLIRYRPCLNLKPALGLLTVGLPLVPATLAGTCVAMSPRYFLERFGSLADVGIFAASSKVASIVSLIFVQPFSLAWMVEMFRIYQRPDAPHIYARVLTYYILVGGILAIGLGINAPLIVHWLSKDSFPLSSDIIMIMALVQVTSGLMYPVNIGPYVRDTTHRVVFVFMTSVLIALSLGWEMTKFWGIQGASYALLSVYVVQTFLLAKVSHVLYPMPTEWRRIIKILVAFLIAFYLTCVINGLEMNSIVWLSSLIFVGIVIVILMLLGFLDDGEVSVTKYMVRTVTRS